MDAGPTVAALYIYPVKGLRGHAVSQAVLEPQGLAGDRRWLLVDRAGRFLTQRQHGAMALIDAAITPTGLLLSAQGHGSLPVAFPHGPPIACTVWRDTVPAIPADPAAGAWIGAVIGADCRLVYLADPAARPVGHRGRPGDCVSFADAYPLLLANTASLAELNTRLATPVPMARFRPNIVVRHAEPWAEDRWRRVAIGDCVLRVVKPCSRCVVTTRDQADGTIPDPGEPLHTLAGYRRAKGGVMFGQNAIPAACGVLRQGDPLRLLRQGASNLVPA